MRGNQLPPGVAQLGPGEAALMEHVFADADKVRRQLMAEADKARAKAEAEAQPVVMEPTNEGRRRGDYVERGGVLHFEPTPEAVAVYQARALGPDRAAQLRLEWEKQQRPRDPEKVRAYCWAWIEHLLQGVMNNPDINWSCEFPTSVIIRMIADWRSNPEFTRQTEYGRF